MDEVALVTAAQIVDALTMLHTGALELDMVQGMLYDASVRAKMLPYTEVDLMAQMKAQSMIHNMKIKNLSKDNLDDQVGSQPEYLQSWKNEPMVDDLRVSKFGNRGADPSTVVHLEPLSAPMELAPDSIYDIKIDFDPLKIFEPWEPAAAAHHTLQNASSIVGVRHERTYGGGQLFDALQVLDQLCNRIVAKEIPPEAFKLYTPEPYELDLSLSAADGNQLN